MWATYLFAASRSKKQRTVGNHEFEHAEPNEPPQLEGEVWGDVTGDVMHELRAIGEEHHMPQHGGD